ncbi:MAG TPA: ACT domain-containing protein [Armatimonadota bacterium]|jgi:aspartokinase
MKQTSFEKERGVTDVRLDADVAHIVVELPEERRTPDQHLDIYKELGKANTPMRLIKMHPGGISFAVERPNLARAEEILTRLGYSWEAADGMVIISIQAINMREMWGVMAKMAETLLDAHVEISQVGDAHDCVLCMVPAAQAGLARATLRNAFGLLPA